MSRLLRPRLTSAPVVAVAVAALLTGCSDDSAEASCPEDGDAAAGGAADWQPLPVGPDSLSVSQEGDRVMAACWLQTCEWDSRRGSYEVTSEQDYVAVSPDWSRTIRSAECGDLALVDTESDEQVQLLTGLAAPEAEDPPVDAGPASYPAAFSTDGTLVAGADSHGTIVVWSSDDGSEDSSVEVDDARRLSFSPDGSRLAVAGADDVVVVDTATGDEVTRLDGVGKGSDVAWSPDGRWLAAAAEDGGPALWDTTGFEVQAALAEAQPTGAESDPSAGSLAFSPDSSRLAFAPASDAASTSVTIWYAKALGGDGTTRELSAHSDPPGTVVFAPDGEVLYSAAARDGVIAWNGSTGKQLARFELPVNPY